MFRRWIGIGLLGVGLCLLLTGCVSVEFSPDGKQIVFPWATRAFPDGLFVMNTDGTGFHPLPGGRDGEQASWSPDGRYIVYSVKKRDAIQLYDTKTGRTRKIAASAGPPFAWREDSRRFAATCVDPDGEHQVCEFSLPDGAAVLRVPLSIAQIEQIEPYNGQMLWLPHTDDLAFTGEHQTERDVFTIEAGEVNRITTTHDVIGFGLSADGKRLVWARANDAEKRPMMTLYSFDLSSRSVARLPFPSRLPTPASDPRHPPEVVRSALFSPRGDRLILGVNLVNPTRRPGKQSQTMMALYTARLDGTDMKRIWKTTDDILIPSWSHDGRQLAVLKIREKAVAIHLYRADGTGGHKLPLPIPPSEHGRHS